MRGAFHQLPRQIAREDQLGLVIRADELRRAPPRGPWRQPGAVGTDFSREMVVGRVAGLGDVALAAEPELEDDGPHQAPTVVGHNLGVRQPLLQEVPLALSEIHPTSVAKR